MATCGKGEESGGKQKEQGYTFLDSSRQWIYRPKQVKWAQGQESSK